MKNGSLTKFENFIRKQSQSSVVAKWAEERLKINTIEGAPFGTFCAFELARMLEIREPIQCPRHSSINIVGEKSWVAQKTLSV